MKSRMFALACGFVAICASPVAAQVDRSRAEAFFKEAAALCAKDGGRLWGVSLCGPIAIADAATHSTVTSQPAPSAPPPPALGFANAAMDWGGTRWTTLVWKMIPDDERQRGVLLIHELFHRVQPQLGLMVPEPDNRHLDSLEGRYWQQLEWRALAQAISASGQDRTDALRDALAFRQARHAAFAGAAGNERALDINEGLAQYTGIVVAASSESEAEALALKQLTEAGARESFVRTFAYVSVPAYGLLLDEVAPDWTRRFRATDDVVEVLTTAARLAASEEPAVTAAKYGGAELRAAEQKRADEHTARVAALRRTFVEGPVIMLPRARNASFITTGVVGIPGAGTVYPQYRTTTEWGTLEADRVLMSEDRSTIAIPVPATVQGSPLKGEGWTLTLAPGWVLRPGPRAGDFVVVRAPNQR